MNKRQVIILWIIACVLAGAVTAVKLSQKDIRQCATHRAPGQTLFESFPGSDISHVEIQGADGTVTLDKKDAKWTVAQREAYPANATYINDFLRTLGDLKITRGMEAGPSFAPRFGMDESANKPADRGLTATFKSPDGKELAKVSLGKNIETGADDSPMGGANAVGRYIRNHADDSGFYASTEMFPSVSSDPARWLADDFISPEKIKSITVSQPGKTDTAWLVSRDSEDAEYKLANSAADEVLETNSATPLKSLFSYARFDDVVTADKVAERADASSKRTVVITTFEGFTYTITLTAVKSTTPPPPPTDPSNPQQPATNDKVLMTVIVSAELPKERKKEANEKPEDAKAKDTAFAERLKSLSEKLSKEKALAGRTFEMGKMSCEALLKDRSQLISKVNPPATAEPSNGAVQKLPGGFITPPPATNQPSTQKPVEAVTPPIAVPPATEKTEPKAEPKKEKTTTAPSGK